MQALIIKVSLENGKVLSLPFQADESFLKFNRGPGLALFISTFFESKLEGQKIKSISFKRPNFRRV